MVADVPVIAVVAVVPKSENSMNTPSSTKTVPHAWVEIDGSEGEGGGQVLRSALAGSLISGRPLWLRKIRAGRRKSGLLRQHLTAVRAATRIGAAEVEGDQLGSGELRFRPQALQAGVHQLSIGSAGSTTLVLQTVLMPLLLAEGESRLVVEGGTHNQMAPCFDDIAHGFLPLVRAMGAEARLHLGRAGFYPAGGGRIELQVSGGRPLRALELVERPDPARIVARAYVGQLPRKIAERELAVVGRKLDVPGRALELEIEEVDSAGPGNALCARVEFDAGAQVEGRSHAFAETFISHGEIDLPSKRVAARLVKSIREYLKIGAPVGPHLADQLMVPMAIAGGRFRTGPLSLHAETNLQILARLFDFDSSVEAQPDGTVLVEMTPR